MGIDVTIALHTLYCILQDRGSSGSAPFVWPAMVCINKSTLNVIVLVPANSQARVILNDGMQIGGIASIPPNIGVLTRRFDDDPSKYKLISTVVLWERQDLFNVAITAGFNVYADALQDAIVANLSGLSSPNPDENKMLPMRSKMPFTKRLNSPSRAASVTLNVRK